MKALPEGMRVEELSKVHDRPGFDCGTPALNTYLRQLARQDAERGLAAVSVFTTDGKTIAAFHTLSAHVLRAEELPEPVGTRLPRMALPVTLLGRMAVHLARQGSGLGTVVLLHALKRALQNRKVVASFAVVVDAKTGAVDFYRKFGFVPLPSQPERLFLLMSEIAHLFE